MDNGAGKGAACGEPEERGDDVARPEDVDDVLVRVARVGRVVEKCERERESRWLPGLRPGLSPSQKVIGGALILTKGYQWRLKKSKGYR